jgi:S-adenosylmethionine:tRNA ribosyltransferase-isomerase
VVRALESSVRGGKVQAGEGSTELRMSEKHRLQVVDALLTGIHDPTASHFELLSAFAPRETLERAYAYADRLGFLGHELGDVCLIGV